MWVVVRCVCLYKWCACVCVSDVCLHEVGTGAVSIPRGRVQGKQDGHGVETVSEWTRTPLLGSSLSLGYLCWGHASSTGGGAGQSPSHSVQTRRGPCTCLGPQGPSQTVSLQRDPRDFRKRFRVPRHGVQPPLTCPGSTCHKHEGHFIGIQLVPGTFRRRLPKAQPTSRQA